MKYLCRNSIILIEKKGSSDHFDQERTVKVTDLRGAYDTNLHR